jgi:hypothetical protein
LAGIGRWGEVGQGGAEEARRLAQQARAAELARLLPHALDPANLGAADQAARVITEIGGLPADQKAAFLLAVAGAAARTAPEAADLVRRRLVEAFPEASERRQRLGEALVRLYGGDAKALSRSTLESKAAQAIASLGLGAQVPARAKPELDRVERQRSFGPFGGASGQAFPPPAGSADLPPKGPVAGLPASAGLVHHEPSSAHLDPAALSKALGQPRPPTLVRVSARPTPSMPPGAVLARRAPPSSGVVRAETPSIGPSLGAPMPPPSAPSVLSAPAASSLRGAATAPGSTVAGSSESVRAVLGKARLDWTPRVEPLRWEGTAAGLMAPTIARLAERASGFIGSVAKVREALWASQDPNARVRYGVERADEHFDRILGKASALQQAARELAPATKAGFFSRLLNAKAGLAEIREHAQGAGRELQEVLRLAKGQGIQTALGEVHQMQRGALLGAAELRLGGGRAAMLADAADPLFASRAPFEGIAPGLDARAAPAPAGADVVPAVGKAGASVSALAADFTQEDLSAIGSALDPSKAPAQTFWSDTMVNLVSSEGRKQGGLSEEQGARDAETARLALEGRGDAQGARLELTAADLAAVLEKAGVDLTRVDPNQVVAAVRYLNGTSSLAAQQEELRKVIDSFHVLGRIGLPRIPREHLLGQLDNFAHLPRKATEKLGDAELQAKFQEIAGTFNAGGELQTKIGKYNLKLSVDAQGQVTKSECKKPGFFSGLWNGIKKLAPIALTVASFIPVTAPFARAVQAGISLVKSIRSRSLLGIATAGANLVGAGVTAIAGKAASAAGTVANRIATIATSTARALQGVSAIRQGSVLGGLANIGGAVASGIGGLAGKTADKLNNFGKTLGDVSDGMLKAATGLSALQAYQRAGRAVDEAKKALAAAQVSGDSRQVEAARRQLEDAERAKQGALFGGLGSAAMVAADMVGGKKTPAPGQSLNRQPAFGMDAALRAASRGLSLTGNVATKDWESAGASALGMAAVLEGPRGGSRTLSLRNAANLTDAAVGEHKALSAENKANRAVAQAALALDAARRSGDREAIAAADEALKQARGAAEGALIGEIAAAETLLRTAEAIGHEHQERGRAKEIKKRVADLGTNLLEALRSPHSNQADKEGALAQLLELAAAGTAYDRALSSGDPARMRGAREAFEQVEEGLGPPPALARVASVGVPDVPRVADGPPQPDSVVTQLRSVEGEGLARTSAIAEWTESEFRGHPERFVHALTPEEGLYLDYFVSKFGRKKVDAGNLSADEIENARSMFGEAPDPREAYANWRNRQTIITNYAISDPQTVDYLGSLYRATRDFVNPPQYIAERGYQVVTGHEAFTGAPTGRLAPALELAAVWAIGRLTNFVVGRALEPSPFDTRLAPRETLPPVEEGEVITVVSPTGTRVTIKDGRPVAWEWNVGSMGQRGTGYRDVEVTAGNHRGHVRSVGEGAGVNPVDDSSLNVVEQSPTVNLSNVKRFESWRIRNAQGDYVIVEQPEPNGLMRVRIPSRQVDVYFDPRTVVRFPDGWFLEPGSTWK